ncbi:MAG: AraC family transcriptional regulator [bacterium]|nr:AraC family transcriptional regulator [bacterium]MCM1375793.1 AraC family transcriptional regulator [Muribaculum sp.]
MERDVRDRFFQMLLECYGLWTWEYDGQLNLLTTNSTSPYFHGLLLLGRDRREVILEHGQKTTVPLIVSNTIGTMWAVAARHDGEGKPESFYAIGPALAGEYARKEIEQAADKLNLSIRNKLAILDCLKATPYVSTNVLFQHAVALHYYVTGKKVRISDFVYHTSGEEQKRKRSGEEKMPHAPHYTEKKLLDMVRTGNLDYHDALSESGSASAGIRMQSVDPVRQARYSVVAFITLCSRAAIEGGLSSEWAYTLSDTYTAAVDSARNVSQIAAISHTMYEDFIRRVNQVRRRKGISRPVRMCCDYIDTHVAEPLTLKSLAEHVDYTEYYLSRKFKAQIGMSINSYICQARMREAKTLLSSTNLSIQEIADRLHFCSRSYFSEQFKKETGMLPVEYRESFL